MRKGGGKTTKPGGSLMKKRGRLESASCSETDEGVGATSSSADKRKRANLDTTRRPAQPQDAEAQKRREDAAREKLMKAATLSFGLTATVRRDDGKSKAGESEVVETSRDRAMNILKARAGASRTDEATPPRRGESHATTHVHGEKSAPGDKTPQPDSGVRQLHRIVAPVAIPACIGIGKSKPKPLSKHAQDVRDRSQEREAMAKCTDPLLFCSKFIWKKPMSELYMTGPDAESSYAERQSYIAWRHAAATRAKNWWFDNAYPTALHIAFVWFGSGHHTIKNKDTTGVNAGRTKWHLVSS
jgi:hypothetical protein